MLNGKEKARARLFFEQIIAAAKLGKQDVDLAWEQAEAIHICAGRLLLLLPDPDSLSGANLSGAGVIGSQSGDGTGPADKGSPEKVKQSDLLRATPGESRKVGA